MTSGNHSSLLRFTISLFIFLLATFANMKSAATEEIKADINSRSTTNTTEHLALYINSPKPLVDLADGITLLLQDRIAFQGAAGIIPVHEVIHEAKKSKSFFEDHILTLKGVPYISMTTEAKYFIIGWLIENDSKQLELTLRSYNVFTGDNISSVEIIEDNGQLSNFLENARLAALTLMNKAKSPNIAPYPANIDLKTTRTLATIWKSISSRRLEHSLSTLADLDVCPCTNGILTTPALINEIPFFLSRPIERYPLATRAKFYDLAGETDKALKLYSRIKLSSQSNKTENYRYVKLLLTKKDYKRVRAVLKKMAPLRKDPVYHLFWAKYHQETGNEKNQIASLEKAGNLGCKSIDSFLCLAKYAKDHNKINLASTCYRKALDIATTNNNMKLRSEISVDLLSLEFDKQILNLIDFSLLDGNRLASISRILEDRQETSTEVYFAKARLAAFENKEDVAAHYYDRTVLGIMKPEYAEYFYKAGKYFLEHHGDLTRAYAYLQLALQIEDSHYPTRRYFAFTLKRQDLCGQAIPILQNHLPEIENYPQATLDLAQLQIDCNKEISAEQTIITVLKRFPEHVNSLVAMIKLAELQNDKNKFTQYFDQLRKIDLEKAKELSKNEKALIAALKIDDIWSKERLPLDSKKFGQFKHLQELQNTLNRILETGGSNQRVKLKDMENVLSSYSKEQIDRIAPKMSSNIDFPRAKLEYRHLQLLLNEKDKPTTTAGTVGFKDLFNELSRIASFSREDIERQKANERLLGMNIATPAFTKWLFDFENNKVAKLGILATLFTIVLSIFSILSLYAYRRLSGSSVVVVNIKYDRSFYEGFFMARLSKSKLSSAFEDEKILKRSRIERHNNQGIISRFFSTLNPFIVKARHCVARFENIPQGLYHLYVSGIQMDVKTQTPVGTVEIEKEILVNNKSRHDVNVGFLVETSYIRLLVKNYHLLSKSSGTDMVIVEVDNNPLLTKTGMLNHDIDLHLPKGTHQINVINGEYLASRDIEVVDTTPVVLEVTVDKYLKEGKVSHQQSKKRTDFGEAPLKPNKDKTPRKL